MTQQEQLKMPEVVWEHAFCTGVAKVRGIAIGHVSLRGRPGNADSFEIVLYNSAGEVNTWSHKPEPAATEYAAEEEKATRRFLKMVADALVKRTPSDVLSVVDGKMPTGPRACQIQGELIDYARGHAGLVDFYAGKIDFATGKLSLDRGDREVSLHMYEGLPVCCIKVGESWQRYQVIEEGVAVLTPEAMKAVAATFPVIAQADPNASLNEYAFDCTLTTALRVKAKSREEAEAIIRDKMNAADCNGGAWPNGDPILFEASINDSELALYELNGESLDNFGKSAA